MCNRITQFLLLLCLLAVTSCQSYEISKDKSLIDLAYDYCDSNISNISYPLTSGIGSKSGDLSYNSLILDWSKAKTYKTEETQVVDVPITGPRKMIAGIQESTDGVFHSSKAVCKSSLIFEYKTSSETPNTFVASIIEKGILIRHSYISDKSKMEGFMVISTPDGKINNMYGYKYSQEYEIPTVPQDFSERSSGDIWAFRLGFNEVTKSGEEDPEVFGWLYCVNCHETYWGNLLNASCPNCRSNQYYGLELCTKCHELLIHCTCSDKKEECPICGRPKILCECDSDGEGEYPGEDHHGGNNGESEYQCPYCGGPKENCVPDCVEICDGCGRPLNRCICTGKE